MLTWCAIALAITCQLAGGAPYIPGEAGAEWSMEELLIVKAKLYALFHQGGTALRQLNGRQTDWMDAPSAPKMLRLGFHDCLK